MTVNTYHRSGQKGTCLLGAVLFCFSNLIFYPRCGMLHNANKYAYTCT